MSDYRVKIHIWYIDGTEETFFADSDYDVRSGCFIWQIGNVIKSVPIHSVKKVEED